MSTGLMTTKAWRDAQLRLAMGQAVAISITSVGFGDANGVPYLPNPDQVQLVRERYRAPIIDSGVAAGEAFIDTIIPADTDDAAGRRSHGFFVHEAGVFGTIDGVERLLAVAQMSGGYKDEPGGQVQVPTFRFTLAVDNPSAISVSVDLASKISIGRLARLPWLTVDGVANAPPADPVAGATWIVGAAPTGAWAGFAHRVAQWVGIWVMVDAPLAHVVSNRALGLSDPAHYIRRTADGWEPAVAASTAHGVVRAATSAEITARQGAGVVTAATLPTRAAVTQMYVTPGTILWTAPITGEVRATVIGAGGGAGGCSGAANSCSSGGAAGGKSIGRVAVVAGQTYAIVVGAGGLGGVNPTAGIAGGSSSFAATVVATGGSGGIAADGAIQITGSAGGNGSGGEVNLGGQGGGVAHRFEDGTFRLANGGRSWDGIPDQDIFTAAPLNGTNGSSPGNGGGGAYRGNGGNGGNGRVILEY